MKYILINRTHSNLAFQICISTDQHLYKIIPLEAMHCGKYTGSSLSPLRILRSIKSLSDFIGQHLVMLTSDKCSRRWCAWIVIKRMHKILAARNVAWWNHSTLNAPLLCKRNSVSNQPVILLQLWCLSIRLT